MLITYFSQSNDELAVISLPWTHWLYTEVSYRFATGFVLLSLCVWVTHERFSPKIASRVTTGVTVLLVLLSLAFVITSGIAKSASNEVDLQIDDRDEMIAAAFDSEYCSTRALADCVRKRDTKKFVAMFGGVQTIRHSWICNVESDSEALHNALSTCQHLLVKNNGNISPQQCTFLKICAETSRNSTRGDQVDAWCGEFLVATIVNGHSAAIATRQATKSAVGVHPSSEHGVMLENLVTQWENQFQANWLLRFMTLCAFSLANFSWSLFQ